MLQIQEITTDPKQKHAIQLPDGTLFSFVLSFVPMQYGWFITELEYVDFLLGNIRVVNSPNMLHQFRNQLPFGLACFSKQNREPMLAEDFSSSNSILYVLTQEEVEDYTRFLVNGD